MVDYLFTPHAEVDGAAWNKMLEENFAFPALLQTYQWATVKAQFGWTPYYFAYSDDAGKVQTAAIVLERTMLLPGMVAKLRMHYVPKGPLLFDDGNQKVWIETLEALRLFAKQRGAFFTKIEPEISLGTGEPEAEDAEEHEAGRLAVDSAKEDGWQFSNEQIQFRNTALIDLTKTEDELLAAMKQKTRYNVRLAGKKGVVVRQGTPADFETLYTIYAETAVRDNFTIRGKDYYLAVWQIFFESGMLTPLIAEFEGEPLAGLMLFHFGKTAWYVYGMSRTVHRNKMPTYLLQWEAMKLAKEKGCIRYDLWGAPMVFDETDSLWGVYRFKKGLGASVLRTMGAYDLPLRPFIYKTFTQALPRLLDFLRSRGNRQTRDDLA